MTFNIKTKGGEVLQQDATINVFAKAKAVPLSYEVLNQYPHSAENFTEGFEVHGNTVYESIGLKGKSKLMKYTLGTTKPIQEVAQQDTIFAEGITLLNDKIYQLTYQSKVGFVYDSNMKLEKQFKYPDVIGEGWGMTNDGKTSSFPTEQKYLFSKSGKPIASGEIYFCSKSQRRLRPDQ